MATSWPPEPRPDGSACTGARTEPPFGADAPFRETLATFGTTGGAAVRPHRDLVAVADAPLRTSGLDRLCRDALAADSVRRRRDAKRTRDRPVPRARIAGGPGDVDAVALLLSEDFAAGELDREAFLRRAIEKLTRFDVDDPRLRAFEVTFAEPGQAVVVFDAVCRVRSPDAYINQFPSRWWMSLRRGGRSWKVTRLETLSTPFSPVRRMRELLR